MYLYLYMYIYIYIYIYGERHIVRTTPRIVIEVETRQEKNHITTLSITIPIECPSPSPNCM